MITCLLTFVLLFVCLFVCSGVRSCVKVEVDVLGSPSLISSPYGLCGRKATLNLNAFVSVAAEGG